MQVSIGLGRMGGGMVWRLLKGEQPLGKVGRLCIIRKEVEEWEWIDEHQGPVVRHCEHLVHELG